jgi:hypothetical protein
LGADFSRNSVEIDAERSGSPLGLAGLPTSTAPRRATGIVVVGGGARQIADRHGA